MSEKTIEERPNQSLNTFCFVKSIFLTWINNRLWANGRVGLHKERGNVSSVRILHSDLNPHQHIEVFFKIRNRNNTSCSNGLTFPSYSLINIFLQLSSSPWNIISEAQIFYPHSWRSPKPLPITIYSSEAPVCLQLLCKIKLPWLGLTSTSVYYPGQYLLCDNYHPLGIWSCLSAASELNMLCSLWFPLQRNVYISMNAETAASLL